MNLGLLKGIRNTESLNGPLKTHYSAAYGVVHYSILLDVKGYNMLDGGLPHDIMHDLCEGVVQYEIKLLLKHLFGQSLLSLTANQRHASVAPLTPIDHIHKKKIVWDWGLQHEDAAKQENVPTLMNKNSTKFRETTAPRLQQNE